MQKRDQEGVQEKVEHLTVQKKIICLSHALLF